MNAIVEEGQIEGFDDFSRESFSEVSFNQFEDRQEDVTDKLTVAMRDMAKKKEEDAKAAAEQEGGKTEFDQLKLPVRRTM